MYVPSRLGVTCLQVRLFRIEKEELDKEISKWDDSGNDIIVLAKQMCMIMMEMTDFTRGRGPLKNTMDVINAAKKISEAGQSLDRLCKDIANEVRAVYCGEKDIWLRLTSGLPQSFYQICGNH